MSHFSNGSWIKMILDIMLNILFTCIGGVIGWITSIKNAKRKELRWASKSEQFLSGIHALPKIQIAYNQTPVINLTSTIFMFWNNGKEVITKDMIVEPIILSIDKCGQIYDAKILYCTSDTNLCNISISDDKTLLMFDFKYLDYKEGAIIHILSGGDCPHFLQLKGRILGCGKFSRSFSEKGRMTKSRLTQKHHVPKEFREYFKSIQ